MLALSALKNVLQLLYTIAHEIIVSNSVSEYINGPLEVSLMQYFFISSQSNNYKLSSGMIK